MCCCRRRSRQRRTTIQRAVVSHELFHVKRRDWAWLLLEEIVVRDALVQSGDVVADLARPSCA